MPDAISKELAGGVFLLSTTKNFYTGYDPNEFNYELNNIRLEYYNSFGIEDSQKLESFSSEYLVDKAEELFGFDINNDGIQGGKYQSAEISNNAEHINEYDFANKHDLKIFGSITS